MTEPRSYSRVFLRALNLEAHIGYYEHEKGVTQPLIVDVELTLAEARFGDDDIEGTIDYDKIAAIGRELAASHADLLETFAERLAQRCLAFDRAAAVRVHVEKPRAVPGAMAGVEILRVK
ncbi:dihydroneopterin aldolase [Labrys sp. KB_33_2]|uniref:dihydroneopterin aldolase n=1 Tax=unclassified Labrys (in: a-proteobacteria) TaxID=2688601 RepID=UPI003EBE1032